METFEGLSYMSDDSSLDEHERDYWEAAALTAHPAPLRSGVPGRRAPAHGEEAAARAAQRALRMYDGKARGLNYSRQAAILDTLRESADRLPAEAYSEAYRARFVEALSLALGELRAAAGAWEARQQEAAAMRARGAAAMREAEQKAAQVLTRGQSERDRCEQEARRLEKYAEGYSSKRLSDARFKA